MILLQVTVLCLLSSLRGSEGNGDQNTTTSVLSSPTNTTVSVSVRVSLPNAVMTPAVATSPKGAINKDSTQATLLTATSVTTTIKGGGATTTDVTKKELITTGTAVGNLSLSSVASTLQSPQHTTKNLSSIETTQRPDASTSGTSVLSSKSTTTPGNISSPQGNVTSLLTTPSTPSHSSIILPVVIALIVITLSVFVLVCLYRMCRKTDPGTPENGNDQPQSDKESVKLLTVKTISHESGEHSAQGKTKN